MDLIIDKQKQLISELNNFIPDILTGHSSRELPEQLRFLKEMTMGILCAKSMKISDLARHITENSSTTFKHTYKRLSRNLENPEIPWKDIEKNITEYASSTLKEDDIVAFDPGDLIKEYSTKMDFISRVHDGDKDQTGNGYELFNVEIIKWQGTQKFHIPMYSKITSNKRPDYISQNYQILEAVKSTLQYTGKKGIWAFDRQHDRSILYEKLFFEEDFSWIIRMKKNRTVYLKELDLEGKEIFVPVNLFKYITSLDLNNYDYRLFFPKKSGFLSVCYNKIYLDINGEKREANLVLVKDKRNEDPVILLTNKEIKNELMALSLFGYYLKRWGIEESYRFCKSFLNLEGIMAQKWIKIKNLFLLLHVAYHFLAILYLKHHHKLDSLITRQLKHFKKLSTIKFKYYRVAEIVRFILKRTMVHTIKGHLCIRV